jgi:hypothetical protein
VRAVVVQDEMHVQGGRHLRIDGVEELSKLDAAMTPMQLADLHTARHDLVVRGARRQDRDGQSWVRRSTWPGRIGKSGWVRSSAWI